MLEILRDVLCGLFSLDKQENYDLIIKDRNAQWDENHALKSQKILLADKAEYEVQNVYKKLLPALAERGRRVLGNLKQSQPRVVRCADYLLTDTATILEPATGGGALGRAYVVDTVLDLQCLYLALKGESVENWEEDPDILIKGLSVITEDEIYGEEGTNG